MLHERLDVEEYHRSASYLSAPQWAPSTWADLALEAGIEYAILMARHADGYTLFDSAASDFTAPQTGPGRDLVQGYVDALRRARIHVGLGYHLADWRRPAYFAGPERDPEGFQALVETAHAQIYELCTAYGHIDMIWLRGDTRHGAGAWRAHELVDMIHQYGALVITEAGSSIPGDMVVHSPHCPSAQDRRPWAWAVPSVERHWGHHIGDRDVKSASAVIRMLATTAERGGSLLLNVGLREEGSMPLTFEDTLYEVGYWLKRNRASIRPTTAAPFSPLNLGCMTVSGPTVYLHVFYWPGNRLCLAGLQGRVLGARFLADGWELDVYQEEDRIILDRLPSLAPDPRNTVIAIEMEEAPRVAPWVYERIPESQAPADGINRTEQDLRSKHHHIM
ncbi:MAG TPA: hypothetical protein GX702_12130, partial [Chloroflexi bacterium]|jgi:alpha-L-fucosidase|nr:hypothetical protein [Chloroflexota bacterium]